MKFADGCVRLVAAIYMFLADTDRRRPMDMSPVNAKLSHQKALCFRDFIQKPEDEFNELIKSNFIDILDFCKKILGNGASSKR